MSAEHKKTALLTGGTGYLGSRMTKKLVDLGFEVILIKRSFSDTSRLGEYANRVNAFNIDKQDLNEVFAGRGHAITMHLATSYGKDARNPDVMVETNLLFPLKLLEIGKKHGVRQFFNIDTSLPAKVSPYALSKKQFLSWLSLYSEETSGFKSVNVALEHFYGPFAGESNFVSKVISAVLSGQPNLSLTPGEQKRDFIYIDDVVDALAAILLKFDTLENGLTQFNVGTGNCSSIRELVQLVAKTAPDCKTTFNFGEIPYRKNEIMESKADLSAITRLGWRPLVSLPQGIAKTIELEKRRGQAA